MLNFSSVISFSAEINGNVGVLHYINDTDSLNWLINSGPHQPYVALLTSLNFNRFVCWRIKNSHKNKFYISVMQTFTDESAKWIPIVNEINYYKFTQSAIEKLKTIIYIFWCDHARWVIRVRHLCSSHVGFKTVSYM